MSTEVRALELRIMSMESQIKDLKSKMLADKAEWLTDKYKGKIVLISQYEKELAETILVKSPEFRAIIGQLTLVYPRYQEDTTEGTPVRIPSLIIPKYGTIIDPETIEEVTEEEFLSLLEHTITTKDEAEKRFKARLREVKKWGHGGTQSPWAEDVDDTKEDDAKAEESFKKADKVLNKGFSNKIEKLQANQDLVLKAGEKIKEIKDSLL